MPRYLQKKRRRWYAVHEIPKALRPVFGRARFVQSLKTDSLVVAERRVHAVVGAWKQAIAEVRGDDDIKVWIATVPVRATKEWSAAFRRRHPDFVPKSAGPPDPRGHGYEVSANAMRVAYQQAKARGDEEQVALIESLIDDAAYHIGSLNVDMGVSPTTDPEAAKFYFKATGQLSTFTEYLDEWLAASQSNPRTQAMQRSDVLRFAKTFATAADVTRPEVRRWITRLINDDGLSPKTVQRILGALRGYWRYMQSIEVAGEDHEPFDRLDVARRNKSNGSRAARQPFDPGDVLRLLDAATERSDDQVADAIRLAMWTGCRIEELCSLKVANVKGDHFTVEDAKTDAGRRDVPIHSSLAQTMTRLITQSADGYVLSGLTINKYGLRSNAISSRFGNLKRGMGFGPQLVFHSLRKTVITLLREAGVPEHVTADLVGHEIPTMTYGLYAGGVSLQVKANALAKLAY